MSRYLKSSNPFEDDDEDNESDFVTVNGDNKPKTPNARSASSSNAAIQNLDRLGQPSTAGSSYPKHGHSQRAGAYSSSSAYSESYGTDPSPFDDRLERLQRQINQSENNQLESTQRALASIYDSEAMGVATAEELVRQGEILDNIETKTDSMDNQLKTSQRHLNSIKSVFGGIKNWWAGDKAKKNEQTTSAGQNSNARLRSAIEKSEHRTTKPDVSGFYEDDSNQDLDSQFMAGTKHKGPGSEQYTMIKPVTRSAREEETDYNLGLMSDGMSRLKSLAMGLGDEIERQNEQLDVINNKVANTDDLIKNQNTQMRKILKKSGKSAPR